MPRERACNIVARTAATQADSPGLVPIRACAGDGRRLGQGIRQGAGEARTEAQTSGRYFVGARDAASRPSDARVRHMRERLIAQVPSRGALADKSATWQLGGGQLIPR